jgi:hypothetical protein
VAVSPLPWLPPVAAVGSPATAKPRKIRFSVMFAVEDTAESEEADGID